MASGEAELAGRADGRSWPIAIIVLTGVIGVLTGALTVVVMNAVRPAKPQAPPTSAAEQPATAPPPSRGGYMQPRFEITRAELTAGLEGREGRKIVWVDNPRAAIPFLHGEATDGDVVAEIKIHGPAPEVWMVEVIPRPRDRPEDESTTTARLAIIGDVLRVVHPGWAARNAWLGETIAAGDKTLVHAEEDWIVELAWTKHGPRMTTHPAYRRTMDEAAEALRTK